jgi:hypothetical protein
MKESAPRARADFAIGGSSTALFAVILPDACRFDFFLFILHKTQCSDFGAILYVSTPFHDLFFYKKCRGRR